MAMAIHFSPSGSPPLHFASLTANSPHSSLTCASVAALSSCFRGPSLSLNCAAKSSMNASRPALFCYASPELARPHLPPSQRFQVMEAMAIGQEVRELKEEIRDLREEIRAKEEEIRAKEEAIKGVEEKIVIASGTEVGKHEAKLQFLRQEIRSIRDEISIRDQQIVSLRQEIRGVRSMQETTASAVEEPSAKRQKSTFDFQIGEKIPMDFASEECNFLKVGVIGTLVSTAGMNKVMESFGGFPANYYVRQEEVYVLETILEKQLLNKEWKFAILGSPGVGKSVLLVFLAFYMVRHMSQSVLLLRQVKGLTGGVSTWRVVFLSQDYYRQVEFEGSLAFGHAHRSLLKEIPGLLYFVDGFSQDDIKKSEFLSTYRMLATSSQFRRKGDDPTEVVVLPPWQVGDLQDFAMKTKMFKPDDTADGLYYYSGGSLREFCRSSGDLKDRVDKSISAVGSMGQTMMLMTDFLVQVDSLRRRYLSDPTDKTQYTSVSSCKYVVDSGYVLRRLLQQCGKEQYKNVYNFAAKAIGGAFHGWAFESYLHKSAISGGFTIQAREYKSRGHRAQYEIKCSESISEGTTESECKTSLQKWAKNHKSKYWYPQYSRFPNIDSVGKAVCKTTGKTILAYIQITVGETHKLDGAWLNDLDEIFKAYYEDRIYVAIQPQSVGSDQKLSLTPSDTETKVPLYEAYFEGSN